MSSMELCALLNETDANTFNPATSKGFKALTEYQCLVEQAAAAARAFLAQELTKFDPTIGDNACQIRTIKTLLLAKDASVVVEMQRFERQAAQVQEACTAKLSAQVQGKQGRKKAKEASPEVRPNLSLSMPPAIAYLVQAYIIGLTHITLPPKEGALAFCQNAQPYPLKLRDLSVVNDNARISRGCAERIIAVIRENLSRASLEFIQEQAQLTKNPVNIAACQEPYIRTTRVIDMTLHSVPIFYSCRTLIQTCRRENIPIVFKVNLYAQDLFNTHMGTEYIAFNHGSREDAAAQNMSPFVCVFEGVCHNTQALLQKFKQQRQETLSGQGECVIYAGAADHAQYMQGIDTIDNLEQLEAPVFEVLRLNSYKKVAQLLGCAMENKSLFFIQHVYPQSRCLLVAEENAGKPKTHEGKDND